MYNSKIVKNKNNTDLTPSQVTGFLFTQFLLTVITTSLFLNWTMEEDGGSPILSYVIRYTALLATPSLTQEEVVGTDPRELVIDLLVPYTTYEVSFMILYLYITFSILERMF